ncbi:acyl--CoA ligase [Mesorhizobium sp. M0062]|uniref:acyl--CoA ligase n=1 Tax=Mesorhizobium sp. M0062 TaxID=2956867 RepID=UPI003338C5C6
MVNAIQGSNLKQALSVALPQLAPWRPAAVALMAPDRPSLSFAGLANLVDKLCGDLARRGVARGTAVGIVLPNGPEMAACFLAVSALATAAPLNPAYGEDEFRFYLGDLDVKLLLCGQGMGDAARNAAKGLGIAVLDVVVTDGAKAGEFLLAGDAEVEAASEARLDDMQLNGPDDFALVLHTSGTTARPKIVGLRQRNLQASMANIARTLALSADDICLNVMPLFHIHGLMAALSAQLAVGGAVVCTPGFNPLKFYGWLGDFRPSWYSAVPTMHQAILARAARNGETIAAARLRFIRSSSAALPDTVFRDLERVFGCPVVEAYGMTEAAHQMTSNGLPPARRKPGSVGLPAGPQVTILDDKGTILPAGEKGEIAVRGANIHDGYLNNPVANEAAFSDGWFRTGDQGLIDEDGDLKITGRLKEIINRGGEKISPLEVDNVLLDHPLVAQAVTFAVPHAMLGEEVGAAIVLAEGATADAEQIRDFARSRIVEFKVPRHILFLQEIPKGPTGKIQRVGLAGKLGLV